MKEFINPEIEIIEVEASDVIATSAGLLNRNQTEAEEDCFINL